MSYSFQKLGNSAAPPPRTFAPPFKPPLSTPRPPLATDRSNQSSSAPRPTHLATTTQSSSFTAAIQQPAVAASRSTMPSSTSSKTTSSTGPTAQPPSSTPGLQPVLQSCPPVAYVTPVSSTPPSTTRADAEMSWERDGAACLSSEKAPGSSLAGTVVTAIPCHKTHTSKVQ